MNSGKISEIHLQQTGTKIFQIKCSSLGINLTASYDNIWRF